MKGVLVLVMLDKYDNYIYSFDRTQIEEGMENKDDKNIVRKIEIIDEVSVVSKTTSNTYYYKLIKDQNKEKIIASSDYDNQRLFYEIKNKEWAVIKGKEG